MTMFVPSYNPVVRENLRQAHSAYRALQNAPPEILSLPLTGDVIILAIGQSNMAGRSTYTTGTKFPENMQQYSQANVFESVLNRTNLEHQDDVNNQYYGGKLSLCVEFANDFVVDNPDANLIFVPHASGGTAFITDRWNKGDDLYEEAVVRANAAMAAKPGATFGGILFHMGETDGVQNNVNFESDLDTFIGDLRADITTAGSNTPFVSGGFSDAYVGSHTGKVRVHDAVKSISDRVPYTANADGSDLVLRDTYHFNIASVRTLGSRYYPAWERAVQNLGSLI